MPKMVLPMANDAVVAGEGALQGGYTTIFSDIKIIQKVVLSPSRCTGP